jgi:predicted nucleotidyltransferase
MGGAHATGRQLLLLPRVGIAIEWGENMEACRPMVSARQIQELGEQIARDFAPERIVVFGSHANGTATEHSDVDLLVIMPCEGEELDQAVRIRKTINVPFALDLLVRTPQTVHQRLAWNDSFLREIMEKGRVIQTSAHGGMGREGGGRLQQRPARVPGA